MKRKPTSWGWPGEDARGQKKVLGCQEKELGCQKKALGCQEKALGYGAALSLPTFNKKKTFIHSSLKNINV